MQSLTLYFPANHGEDTTRISFLGFKGEYTPLTVRQPVKRSLSRPVLTVASP